MRVFFLAYFYKNRMEESNATPTKKTRKETSEKTFQSACAEFLEKKWMLIGKFIQHVFHHNFVINRHHYTIFIPLESPLKML